MSVNNTGQNHQAQPPHGDDEDGLFTIRTALIMLLAVIIGLIVGLLMVAAGHNLAEAVLAGLGSGAGTLAVAPTLIRTK